MDVTPRWTGLEAAALRQARRLSIRAYAAQLGVSPSTVGNWDGRGRLVRLNSETQQLLDIDLARASDDIRQRFAALLGCADQGLPDRAPSGANLDRALSPTVDDDLPLDLRAMSIDGAEPGSTWPLALGGGADVDPAAAHVRRRSLLTGLATVAAAAGFVSVGNGPRRRIGHTDIARLNALTSLYRLADQEFGAGSLVDDVSQFAEAASVLLDHLVSDSVRPHLLVAIASARDLAGWTAFDATRHIDAQRHFGAAERMANEAGDNQLVAHVRYGQAKQMQHLLHNRDALDILRAAQHQLDETPALTTILRGAEAASRASLGDWEGAQRALGDASDSFAAVDPSRAPEWLSCFDKAELLAQYGRVYRDWARADRRRGGEAVQWVSDAIKAFGPQNGRSTVLNQVGLASAYFLADAPDLALDAGRAAQRQAKALTSPRVIERIANLRRDAAKHMHLPDVDAFVRSLPRPVPLG